MDIFQHGLRFSWVPGSVTVIASGPSLLTGEQHKHVDMNVRTGRPQGQWWPLSSRGILSGPHALGECRARYSLGKEDISNESQKVAVGVDGRGLLAIPALLVHQQRRGF